MTRLDPTKCDFCGLVGDDRASVSDEDREWGFCSRVCMVLFVSERYLEANAVLSISRATAAPASGAVGPPSMVACAGTGGTRDLRGSGNWVLPTSDGGRP